MRRAIVISRADPVSMGIAEILIESFNFSIREGIYRKGEVELHFIDEKHIYAEMIGERLGVDLVVFPSSHKSEKGIRAFLTHAVGNWRDEASYGGRPRKLSKTSALMLRKSLQTLLEEVGSLRIDGWDVRLEVTHHGPFTEVPTIFVEVGGDENSTPGEKELEVVATASLKAAETEIRKDEEVAIGFGGGHYAPTFTKLVANGSYNIGHMCPKYALPIDREVVREAIEKIVEKTTQALIDWKGIPSDYRRTLVNILESYGLEIVKT
ncbi:MAG: D-aminoacyl-tRNA deacylase [Nitrososphaerota archaeon]